MAKQAYRPIRDIRTLEFLYRIPDEESAVSYLERLRWGGGLYCPHCGNADGKRILSGTSTAAPLQRVWQALQRPHRHGYGIF